jgi:DNA modification methylase
VIDGRAPAMAAKLRPLVEISPYPGNPRTHPPAQVAMLSELLRKYGADQPIVVDEKGVILKGHGRRLAALLAGFEEFPVVERLGLSEGEKIAMRIEDNQVALLSGWDQALMKVELLQLQGYGHSVLNLGFPEVQLRSFGVEIGNAGQRDPEITPEKPKQAVSKTGDVWLLGDHRILCGDVRSDLDLTKLLADEKLDLVFTDPPYNVAYSGLGQNRLGTIENDDQTDEAFGAWIDEALRSIGKAMRTLACIYVCHPDSASAPKIAFENAFAGSFKKSSTIIWAKQSAGMGWQDYRAQHEPILYGWKEGKGKHFFAEDRTRTTIWSFDRDSHTSYVHPTQKPVALAQEAIINSSKQGWKIGDLFAGSGTTIIAAEITRRVARAMEIDPGYVDVAVRRWEGFTGRIARLEATGQTFEETRVKRNRKSKSRSTPLAEAAE